MKCYKILLFVFDYLFDLPIYWTHSYTRQQILKEADFVNEGQVLMKYILKKPHYYVEQLRSKFLFSDLH